MTQHENDKPPFFSNWASWYVLVLLFLVVLIIIFYLITKRFA